MLMEQEQHNTCSSLIIYNNLIPFKGFKAINLFGIIFARKEYTLNAIDINHERIHTAQQKELLFIFFYIWYLIEWLINLIIYRDFDKAYAQIKFEKEAYANQYNFDYLNNRKFFAFLQYF